MAGAHVAAQPTPVLQVFAEAHHYKSTVRTRLTVTSTFTTDAACPFAVCEVRRTSLRHQTPTSHMRPDGRVEPRAKAFHCSQRRLCKRSPSSLHRIVVCALLCAAQLDDTLAVQTLLSALHRGSVGSRGLELKATAVLTSLPSRLRQECVRNKLDASQTGLHAINALT